jgi:hypothetical protein
MVGVSATHSVMREISESYPSVSWSDDDHFIKLSKAKVADSLRITTAQLRSGVYTRTVARENRKRANLRTCCQTP